MPTVGVLGWAKICGGWVFQRGLGIGLGGVAGSAGRDRYSGNAGEGRNLLTTIREPQLYATEGFMRMWVISSTVESNIINTCCCFFCFCKNAHKKFSARTPLSDSTMRCWISMHSQIPIHGMNEMLQDCRHLCARTWEDILWHEMQCGDERIACVHGVDLVILQCKNQILLFYLVMASPWFWTTASCCYNFGWLSFLKFKWFIR